MRKKNSSNDDELKFDFSEIDIYEKTKMTSTNKGQRLWQWQQQQQTTQQVFLFLNKNKKNLTKQKNEEEKSQCPQCVAQCGVTHTV